MKLAISFSLSLCFGLQLFAAGSLTIFAAASTNNVISDAAVAYKKKGGPTPLMSFAASSTLARQIEKGAPVDIFLSANVKWMNYLEEKGLIDPAGKTVLFGNRLVMISSIRNPVTLKIKPATAWLPLIKNEYLAIADPDHTPAGGYAKQALTWLDCWDEVQGRIARTRDVRAALMLVEREETPLGIVYLTDAAISKRTNIVGAFPGESHAPIVYLCALTTSAANREDALAFLNFLQSETAKAIYVGYGFVTGGN